jgi:hypothetical protein
MLQSSWKIVCWDLLEFFSLTNRYICVFWTYLGLVVHVFNINIIFMFRWLVYYFR